MYDLSVLTNRWLQGNGLNICVGGLHKGKSYAEQLINEQVAARRIIRGAQELLLARAKELQDQANAALDSCPKDTLGEHSPGQEKLSMSLEMQEDCDGVQLPSSATKRAAISHPNEEIRPSKRHG